MSPSDRPLTPPVETSSRSTDSSRRTQESQTLLDTKQIADAVVELNISRKNLQIYPPEHDQVERSLKRTHRSLKKTLHVEEQITFGIAKDTLMIGDAVLDPDNAVFKEFAIALKRHDIAAVTFQRGVGEEELNHFLAVITKSPEDVYKLGGVEMVFSTVSCPHILIRVVDYTRFQVTEEKEIVHTKAKDPAWRDDSIWQDFITHFVSGTISDSDEDPSLEEFDRLSPIQLGKMLNKNQADTTSILSSYDKIISKHLQKSPSRIPFRVGRSTRPDPLNILLQSLKPELRRQFLSVTFKNCNQQSNAAGVEAFLADMPYAFIIDMLRQANNEGREISPSLLALIRKLSSITSTAPDPLKNVPTVLNEADDMQFLFKREDHEQYIEPGYDELLQELSDDPESEGEDSWEEFPLADYIETMESPHLDIQISQVILAFLKLNLTVDEYRDYVDRLLSAVPFLISAGEFSTLLSVVETFSKHATDKATEGFQPVAENALEQIKTPAYITKTIKEFDRKNHPVGSPGYRFLEGMGNKIVPEIVSLFLKKENANGDAPLMTLLGRFRKEAVTETVKRLNAENALIVKNALSILRLLQAEEAATSVKPLLDHPDPVIHMPALRTILTFSLPEAIPYLRRALYSRQEHIFSEAVALAGQYRVRDVVPDLLEKLKQRVLFKRGYRHNEKLVAALGRIGDTSALPHLKVLAAPSFSLYPKLKARMIQLIFESLEGYPYESIEPFLKTGYQSKDKTIRSVCQRIRKKTG